MTPIGKICSLFKVIELLTSSLAQKFTNTQVTFHSHVLLFGLPLIDCFFLHSVSVALTAVPLSRHGVNTVPIFTGENPGPGRLSNKDD